MRAWTLITFTYRVFFIKQASTLPIVFNKDLTLIQHPIRLHSSNDLAEITERADQDRKHWRVLASQIEKASEVSQIKNYGVTRQKVSKSDLGRLWYEPFFLIKALWLRFHSARFDESKR